MSRGRFESIVIFTDKLVKPLYDKAVDTYRQILEDHGARMIYLDRPGKKKLAYDVKGSTEGWYAVFTFEASCEKIPVIEKIYRMDDDIIKFITLRTDDSIDKDEDEDEEESGWDRSEQDESDAAKTPVDVFKLIYGI